MAGHCTSGCAGHVVGLQSYICNAPPRVARRLLGITGGLAMPVTEPEANANESGREYALFVRHSSVPRLSAAPRSRACLAKRATWLRSRGTTRLIRGRTVGSDVRPGGEIRCTGRVRSFAQPLGTQALMLHSIGLGKSVCRTANIRSRPVGAHFRPSGRHMVRSAAFHHQLGSTKGIYHGHRT
jgi:hypothetical protein